MTGTIPKVIDMARRAGLYAAANKLDCMYKIPAENGDEPMNLDTVKSLVLFLIEHPGLDTSTIGTDPNGFVSVIWSVTRDSKLYAQFLPSGSVWFEYAVDESNTDGFRILKSGDASPNDMLKAIAPLIEQSA